MRTICLLLTFVCITFVSLAQTPTVLYDFENSETTTGGYGGVQTNVANPDATGINTSANVLQWIPDAANVGGSWNNALQNWFGTYDFSNINEIQMKVYYPADATNFRPELKNEVSGTTIADVWVTPTEDTWTLVTLDISALTIPSDENIQLYFWFNPNATTAGPFYIDDIVLIPKLTAPVVSLAKLVGPSQVNVEFSKDMNDPTGTISEWGININGSAATVSAVAIDANDATMYNFTISESAEYGDDITLNYTVGTVESTDGYALSTISDMSVKNGIYKTLSIDKLGRVPVIDGIEDLIWKKIAATGIDTLIMTADGTTPSATDLSASYKAAYNDTAFFYFVSVNDEKLVEVPSGATSPWNYDNIELYISGYNSQAASFQTGDINVRLNINYVSQKTANTQAVMTETSTGYLYEVCVPFADIDAGLTAQIAAGYEIGFEVKVVDDDTDGSPEHQMVWNNASGVDESYKRTDDYGTLKLTSTVLDLAEITSLSTLSVNNGDLIPAFASSTLAYAVELPFGTTVVPSITATATDSKATVTITKAASLPGTSYVTVVAEDTAVKEVYEVEFTITEPAVDASLNELSLSAGTLYPEFSSETTAYSIELPIGSTDIPTVSTAESTDANATVVIEDATAIPGEAKITVTAQDGKSQVIYRITMDFESATNAKLSNLTVSVGTLSPSFSGDSLSYKVQVPFGITDVPELTAITADASATFVITNAETLSDTSYVNVLAEDHINTLVYQVTFSSVNPSIDATLKSLSVADGILEPAFSSLQTTYSVILPVDMVSPTTVYAEASSELATLSYTYAEAIPGATKIKVTAQDGVTFTEYVVNMLYAKNNVATLDTIMLSEGELSPAFSSDSMSYMVSLPWGSDSVPSVSVITTDTNATYSINNTDSLPGITSIVVMGEDSVSTKTYTLAFNIDPEPTYTLSFKVVDGDNSPIRSASVVYDGETLSSDSKGIVIFDSVSASADTNYTVSKSGYQNYTGAFEKLTEDVEIKVELELILSIVDQNSSLIKAYPNPSNGLVNIEVPQAAIGANILIFNTQGKIVYQQEAKGSINKINLTTFESGIYFVKIGSDERYSLSRIILE